MILKCLFWHKIHWKAIYITAESAGFFKDSHQFSILCLLSFAFSFSSFQAILYCPVIWATDAKSFYPFIPQSRRICSKCGKAVGSQARAAGRELKEGGNFGPWDHKSTSSNTAGRGEDSVERDAVRAAGWRRRVYKWLFPSLGHKGLSEHGCQKQD